MVPWAIGASKSEHGASDFHSNYAIWSSKVAQGVKNLYSLEAKLASNFQQNNWQHTTRLRRQISTVD